MLIIFFIGAILGSFLSLCIDRIPKGINITIGRSRCNNCKVNIEYFNLVPIISYISLGGKCKHCKNKIPYRNILVEVATGIITLMLFIKYGISFLFIKQICFVSLMIIIGLIDLETGYVYTNIIIKGILMALVLIIVEKHIYNIKISNYLLGGLVGFIIIFIINKLTKGAMGEGDIYILLLIGLFLGVSKIFNLLFLSFILGGIIASFLLITKLKNRKDFIPFGPILLLSSIIIIFI